MQRTAIAAYCLAKVVKLLVDRERPADILHDVAMRGQAQSGLGFLPVTRQ